SWGLRHSSHARRASAPWRAKCSVTCCRQPAETTQGPCSPSTTPHPLLLAFCVTTLCPKKGVWNSPASIMVESWAPESSRHLFLGKAASRHFKNTYDFDRDIARQRAHTYGSPGSYARIDP